MRKPITNPTDGNYIWPIPNNEALYNKLINQYGEFLLRRVTEKPCRINYSVFFILILVLRVQKLLTDFHSI
jgi:hypothetical protein